MSVLVLDAGNSIIKFARRNGQEGEFPHALKEITTAELDQVKRLNASKLPVGYARVNGQAYAYGDQAERYGAIEPRSRAARYTADYYGVFVAIALALSYNKNMPECFVFGSHAPGDTDYRDELMEAAMQDFEVEVEDRTRKYSVKYANTFTEPQGGLMNVILAEDGQHYRQTEINGGRALVIDIGGRTTDWLAVHPYGEIDYSLQESSEVGILDVISSFEKAFRSRYKAAFQSASELPIARVRLAISSGLFHASGRDYECKREAEQATNIVLSRITNAYRTKAGGGVDYDSIILTGGGSGLLYDHLLGILKHDHIILADDPQSIHLANVRGGLKLWRNLEAAGALE